MVTFFELSFGNPDAGDARETMSASDIAQRIREVASDPSSTVTRIWVSGLAIEGAIDLSSINLDTMQLPALHFDNCVIDTLIVRESICGRIAIRNSSIVSFQADGAVFRSGLNFGQVVFGKGTGAADPAISLYRARVTGDLFWSNLQFESDQPLAMALSGIEVTGRLVIINSNIKARFLLEDARLGSLVVHDSMIDGAILAQMLRVDGNISFTRATIGNGNDALSGHGCEVGAAVMVSASHLKGKLRLYSSRIGINVEIKDRSTCEADDADTCMDFCGSTIGNCISVQAGSSMLGQIHLHQAQVGGLVELDGAFFSVKDSSHASLCFGDSRMGGLFIARCVFKSDLKLLNIEVSGDVVLGSATHRFDADTKAERDARLLSQIARSVDLSGARIGGRLRVTDSLTVEVGDLPVGETPSFGAVPRLHLFLDGAKVDAIELPPPERRSALAISWIGLATNRIRISSVGDAANIIGRLKQDASYWLDQRKQLQIQPFIHFAQHMRAAGWHDHADALLIEMKRIERRAMSGPAAAWNRAFDLFFRFGFGKLRSAVTLALWILLGTIGTSLAVDKGALVRSAQVVLPAVSVSHPGGDASPSPMMVYGNPAPYSELRCQGEIVPVYYAIELVLPIFDLGQRDQCDLRGGPADRHWYENSSFWWWLAKYVYVVIGWIIVSMTLLTFLGTLKMRAYGSL